MNKIKSFLELFHAKHWICAHSVCGDDDITADSIKVFLLIAKQVNLIRLKWDEVLVDDTFVQIAQATWLVISFELGMNPDGALMTTAFQIINGSKDGHMATKAWCEVGDHPMDMKRFGIGVVLQ